MKIIDCNDKTFLRYAEKAILYVINRAIKTGRRSVISLAFVPTVSSLDGAVRLAISHNVVVVTAAGKD